VKPEFYASNAQGACCDARCLLQHSDVYGEIMALPTFYVYVTIFILEQIHSLKWSIQ